MVVDVFRYGLKVVNLALVSRMFWAFHVVGSGFMFRFPLLIVLSGVFLTTM